MEPYLALAFQLNLLLYILYLLYTLQLLYHISPVLASREWLPAHFFTVPAPLSHTVNIHYLVESIFFRPFRHCSCSPPITAFPINPRAHGSFSLRRNAGYFLEKSLKKELTTGHSGDMIQKEYSSFMYKFAVEGSRWKW